MINLTHLAGQIIQSGKMFQLTFLILFGILTFIAFYLGKRGRTWEIRPLEGLEATYEGIGRSAEMGRPIMVLPGISDLGNPQTLAGLTVYGEVSQRAAEIGVVPMSSATESSVITAQEAIVNSAFTAAGKPELYSPGKYIRWFGGDQFSYAVGAAGYILSENPAVIIYLGYILFDVIVDGETGNRIGAVQIGGTLGSMDMVALFSDYILIGEEIFAASAAITQDKAALATIAGQDWLKIVSLAIMIIGSVLILAGSNIIIQMLEA